MKTFDIIFSGTLEQLFRFDESRFMGAVERKFGQLFDKLQNKIVAGKLSGEVLNRRSGLLAASVSDPQIETEGTTITGMLTAAGGAAFYGQIHEHGGTHSYTIRPVDKKALRMILGGKEQFRAMVQHPPLPQRAWFDPSVEEMKEEFIAGIREACIEGIE